MIDVQIVMLSGQKYDYKTDDQNIESEYFKRYSKGELFAVVMKNITHHTNGTKSVTIKKSILIQNVLIMLRSQFQKLNNQTTSPLPT